MKVTIRVVVTRDGSYNGMGYGTKGVFGDVDEGLLFEAFDLISESDTQMVTVEAEVDLDKVFAKNTIKGRVVQ